MNAFDIWTKALDASFALLSSCSMQSSPMSGTISLKMCAEQCWASDRNLYNVGEQGMQLIAVSFLHQGPKKPNISFNLIIRMSLCLQVPGTSHCRTSGWTKSQSMPTPLRERRTACLPWPAGNIQITIRPQHTALLCAARCNTSVSLSFPGCWSS